MVDGEGGVGGDLALVGTFFVVVLVGTFASQVRSASATDSQWDSNTGEWTLVCTCPPRALRGVRC